MGIRYGTRYDTIYIVLAWNDICKNGNYEPEIMGAFSTVELAEEASDEIMEAGMAHHCSVEFVEIDRYSWR